MGVREKSGGRARAERVRCRCGGADVWLLVRGGGIRREKGWRLGVKWEIRQVRPVYMDRSYIYVTPYREKDSSSLVNL